MAIPRGLIVFLGRALGFILLFAGSLVAVVAASYGGGCWTSVTSCVNNASWASGVANAILTSKILWVIGLFFLGAASGLKLHWELPMPSSGGSDQVAFVIADRRLNGLILILCIVFLFLILLTVNILPLYPPGAP
ncbi:MAG: hypothetical protein L3K09_02690 [Thermoplasmata archaeon]|nr:hypothetical protein [Thermoplasmata archaeon]